MKQFFKKAMNWGQKYKNLADFFFFPNPCFYWGEGKNAFFKAPVRHKVALLDLSLWVSHFEKT